MAFSTANAKIQSASRAHITLLDGFIRMTEDKIGTEENAFVRESLNDLLTAMRDERDGYVRLCTPTLVLEPAA